MTLPPLSMNATNGKIVCPSSLEHANFSTSYTLHYADPKELEKHGGVCGACFRKFAGRNHTLDGSETPAEFSNHHRRQDPELDHIAFTEDGQIEQTVDFDFSEVDKALGMIEAAPENVRAKAGELLRELLGWVWGGSNTSLRRATIRFSVLAAGLRPELVANWTYEKIANETRVTKQNVSKTGKLFERAFGFHFSRSRPESGCERMRESAIGHPPTNTKPQRHSRQAPITKC